MKGYKVFNPDWTCRGFQYEVGQTYEMDGEPICCERGFHFCLKPADCFNFYDFTSENKVAEVEALGDVDKQDEHSKCSTNKIRIVRELTWHEVLDLVNTGKDCTGLGNSGNRNSGNRNSGDWNSGDWNSGNGNSGDWNKASNCVGCFNTENKPLFFFDKPTDITMQKWRNSKAYMLLNRIDLRPVDWIWFCDMTDAEKEEHPDAKITNGYLKVRDNTDCCKEWWNGLSEIEKDIIKNIPNFDAKKFYIITGINVEADSLFSNSNMREENNDD